MMLKSLVTTILILSSYNSWAESKKEICPGVVFHGKIKLTPTEKRLVCGDKELEGYKDIPSYEASFFLTGFLQSRGHLNPRYEKEGEVLHVHIGRRSKVKKIRLVGELTPKKKLIRTELKRLYKRRILETSVLNSIEAEALSLLRQNGYPCAEVKSHVNAQDDTVTVEMKKLAFHHFGPVDREKVEGLEDTALDRFYPFTAEMPFDESLLTLTEKRMMRKEVVQGTYFREKCGFDPDTFALSQNFIVGPPRTLRMGGGVSTEVGPMARLRWSHNRYKSMASNLSANLQASFRSQSINLSADYFAWKDKPRRSFFPQVEVVRDSQLDFEQVVMRARPHMKFTQDVGHHFGQLTWGPSYEAGTYYTKDNSNTKSFATGLLEGSFQWMSHDYEVYDFHPQEGDQFTVNLDYRHPSMGFSDQMLRLDSSFVRLGRIMNFGRGTLIGATRLNAGTNWVSDDVSVNGLPPAVKFYGGGSDDVRGFQLRTLPRTDGEGALTKLGIKLELRKTYLFKESLEGFTFVDGNYFGLKSWSIAPQLYYSPGLGLRWLSPIGMVQGFVARGLATNPYKDHGNLYYIGLGGVF